MAKMKYLVVHCTDTPYNRNVSKDDIKQWHLLPAKNADGTYTYKGIKYNSIESLPDEKIAGLDIKKYAGNGRGWKKCGYADMIDRTGKLINITPYNFDDVIDSAEVTNGAAGYNSESRHVVLAGGWSKDGKNKTGKGLTYKDLYTEEQLDTLEKYIRMQIEIVPDVIVCGHCNLASKSCPNFDVKQFCIDRNILNAKFKS